jgi:aminoglycoside 6'-N-acetyltransferase
MTDWIDGRVSRDGHASGTEHVSFGPLTRSHLPLFTGWLQQPHVRAFWDDGERDEASVAAQYFGDGREPGFIFSLAGRPAGFIQRERVTAEHEWARWARGETWGLDLLIGEAELIGRGHGPAVIAAFLARTCAEHGVQRFLIDPDCHNLRAIRAYRKVGFGHLAELGDLRLMALDEPARQFGPL